jgi:predicted nucleic acid-binding protein
MNDKSFLDTNIFLYSFDLRVPRKAARANELIRQAHASGNGIVSFQVVQEFFNVALRKSSRRMPHDDAQRYLADVLGPLVAVQSSQELYAVAIRLYDRYRFSWYDAVIVAAAMEAGCHVLLTEDLQDGMEVEGLRIENPFKDCD